jgi:hypothetical protein
MNNKIKIVICMLLVFEISCQKIFIPKNIESNENIPVIEGYVYNTSGPHTVRLSWASPYSKEENRPITNAKVSIRDNKGHYALYYESDSGLYLTQQGDLTGIPGNKYILKVELPDGGIFTSNPETMPIVPVVDSSYAMPGTREAVSKNEYGDLLISHQKGLFMYVNLSSGIKETMYYKFGTSVITEKEHYQTKHNDTALSMPFLVQCWSYGSVIMMLPDIAVSYLKGKYQVVKQQDLGFLNYTYSPMDTTDSTTAPTIYGWVAITKIYSITASAYNYYQAETDQLSAKESIFDPIPSQITGNIRCTSDTTRLVLGLFEVGSIDTTYTFYSYTGSKTYGRRVLTDFEYPEVPDGCSDDTSIKKMFWVSLY